MAARPSVQKLHSELINMNQGQTELQMPKSECRVCNLAVAAGSNKVSRPLLIAVLLLALPMVMLYPLWDKPLSAGEDDAVYYFPLRKMVAENLRQGELPLYNHREATGMPLMADPQSAVMHPLTWLFVALPAGLAYSLSIFGAFALAGGGAYLYMRRLGLVRAACLIGAIAFMFCGFMVGHRVHLSVIQAAAMLPWGLLCIEGLRGRCDAGLREKGIAALWLVPVIYLAVAAGHWPTVIHMGLIWLAYGALRLRPFVSGAALAVAAGVLAGAAIYPQISITRELMAQVTRHSIPYAMAGENSFLPTSAVLAVMPFFQGTRNPNFFSQEWWGSWHLCEMLGYVGLLTLSLALGAMWKLRKRRADPQQLEGDLPAVDFSLIRTWTWIVFGAGIFMLGYYLPTYKLVHMLPVLGVMRCPARMVLAVDMGLAVLAAAAVHAVMTNPNHPRVLALRRGVLGVALVAIPAAIAAMLAFWAIVGRKMLAKFPEQFPALPFEGGAQAAIDAARLDNPAVYVPLIVLAATSAVLVLWLRRRHVDPAGSVPTEGGELTIRAMAMPALLIALLLGDLFIVTRFVDVPGERKVATGQPSRAARWLQEHDGAVEQYRVWGLGKTYFHRADELLMPKTCEAMGISTIANYGPFQSSDHAQLFGFRIWGASRDWESLLRRNHLLSMYGVKYIIAADWQHRAVLESVRVQDAAPHDGPNMLTDQWEVSQNKWFARLGALPQFIWEITTGISSSERPLIRLKTPLMFMRSYVIQPVQVEPGKTYRISLEASARNGAGLFLAAGLVEPDEGELLEHDELTLIVQPEQIGQDWRRYEQIIQPQHGQDIQHFYMYTMSEWPIEVQNISLCPSRQDAPLAAAGGPAPGERVYEKVAEIRAANKSDAPVCIYLNKLWQPVNRDLPRPAEPPDIERLKQGQPAQGQSLCQPLDISLRPVRNPGRLLLGCTLPAGIVWLGAMTFLQRKRKSGEACA